MSSSVDVAGVDELVPGTCRLVDIDGTGVAVFNIGGEYFAFQNACPHDGGDLAQGKLDGEVIMCPRHGARFSIRTGAVLSPPAYEDLRTFSVKVAQGRLYLTVA